MSWGRFEDEGERTGGVREQGRPSAEYNLLPSLTLDVAELLLGMHEERLDRVVASILDFFDI